MVAILPVLIHQKEHAWVITGELSPSSATGTSELAQDRRMMVIREIVGLSLCTAGIGIDRYSLSLRSLDEHQQMGGRHTDAHSMSTTGMVCGNVGGKTGDSRLDQEEGVHAKNSPG